MKHSSELKKYWYVASFQDNDAGAVVAAMAGCEGTPALPMPKFERTIVHAVNLEHAYELGGEWAEAEFPDEIFLNDYAFLADDYEKKQEEPHGS